MHYTPILQHSETDALDTKRHISSSGNHPGETALGYSLPYNAMEQPAISRVKSSRLVAQPRSASMATQLELLQLCHRVLVYSINLNFRTHSSGLLMVMLKNLTFTFFGDIQGG